MITTHSLYSKAKKGGEGMENIIPNLSLTMIMTLMRKTEAGGFEAGWLDGWLASVASFNSVFNSINIPANQ